MVLEKDEGAREEDWKEREGSSGRGRIRKKEGVE